MRATYAIWCNPDGMLNDDRYAVQVADRQNFLLMEAAVDHLDHRTELAEPLADFT